MRLSRWTVVGAMAVLAMGVGACSLPTSSLARPVTPMKDGAALLSGGAMVPFMAVGSGPNDDDNKTAAFEPFAVWPYVAGDGRISERWTLGLSASTFEPLQEETGDPERAIFVVPRMEFRDENIAFSADVTLWFGASDAFLAFPSVGIRYYRPVGDVGGLVLTQQLGTLIVTTSAPGSLAWDLPIDAGVTTLHVFPELRWDPTWFAFDSEGYFVALFSGGLTFMVEL